MSGYISQFLGRMPGSTEAMQPQMGRVQIQAPPRPPGHPSSPEAVQPGPHPMGPGGFDPNMLVPAQMMQHQPRIELSPLEQFLLTRHPRAV